jgi:hypothetical protein
VVISAGGSTVAVAKGTGVSAGVSMEDAVLFSPAFTGTMDIGTKGAIDEVTTGGVSTKGSGIVN